MSKQRSGGDPLPNDFAHAGKGATTPPRRPAPGGIGDNENGHSRGKQGKG